MSKTVPFLTTAVALLLILTFTGAAGGNWSYQIINFETNCMNETVSKNEHVIDINVRPVRIQPGVYALNGTVSIAKDLDAHLNKVEGKTLHSSTGSSQYKLTPYQIPKCSLHTYMNTYYKKYAMEDVSKCVTGLDAFEDEWEGPFKAGHYVLNECILKTDELPPNLAYGYYKFTGHLFGPLVDCEIFVTIKISRKM